MRKLLTVVLAVLICSPAYARHAARSLSSTSSYAEVSRDSHGRIRRSGSARREFMRDTGYALGRPGYVIDHIVPLACGGPDDPSNMQWQTIDDAKAKDKWERKDCSIWKPGTAVHAL